MYYVCVHVSYAGIYYVRMYVMCVCVAMLLLEYAATNILLYMCMYVCVCMHIYIHEPLSLHTARIFTPLKAKCWGVCMLVCINVWIIAPHSTKC